MVKIDRADKLFSLWIRTRDRAACQRCGKVVGINQGLHCSHFMGRGKENTRFEPLNCDALCFGCHQFFTSHPAEHYLWQVERKGQAVIDKLRLAAHTYKKRDRKLEAIYWQQRLLEDFNIKD